MRNQEYDIRIAKVRNKVTQLLKDSKSYNLSYSEVDIEKEIAILEEEVADIKNELEVEDFLLSVEDLLIEEGYYTK